MTQEAVAKETLRYVRLESGGWVGQIGHVRVYVSDEEGAPSRAQAAVAAMVARALPALREAASAYLDTFVDRRKACGSAQEPWWLDEIDVRDRAGKERISCALLFTLHGDDGGLWTVDMQESVEGHRPFRFERRQG
ncbi:hypothetical protein [Methylobacterium oryzisoli]|uniref:hypothetical protein n=1 Tax=Methylobacterium oryzisoli TaxID=3385502 RepID=UPI0038926F27